MAEVMDEIDLSQEIEEDQMINIEGNPETETGRKEALGSHPDRHHAMIPRKEVLDPLPMEDHKGIHHGIVTKEEIQTEGMAGVIIEKAATDHIQEIGQQISPSTIMEGRHTILEPVTIVGKDRGMIEVDVVKELHPGKDKETAEEMKVVEEKESKKMVKVVMLS